MLFRVYVVVFFSCILSAFVSSFCSSAFFLLISLPHAVGYHTIHSLTLTHLRALNTQITHQIFCSHFFCSSFLQRFLLLPVKKHRIMFHRVTDYVCANCFFVVVVAVASFLFQVIFFAFFTSHLK